MDDARGHASSLAGRALRFSILFDWSPLLGIQHGRMHESIQLTECFEAPAPAAVCYTPVPEAPN
eukprot:3556006-Pyramimonas_sp.AAC.1